MNRLLMSCCVAVLVIALTATGFGWGNATHVYFAKQMGVKIGTANLNEMYGALLPDMTNLLFNQSGQTLAFITHWNTDLIYQTALNEHNQPWKALAFGAMTHNNSWGVDFTAHGGDHTNPDGWVIKYGAVLGLSPAFQSYLAAVLADAGMPSGDIGPAATRLGPLMGHDLVETAVDILVKREVDPLIGVRMALAARTRSSNAAELMAKAYGPALATSVPMPPLDAEAFILGGEAGYRQAMIQYGEIFTQREPVIIEALSAGSAALAAEFIPVVLMTSGMTPPPKAVVVDPAKVALFLQQAIGLVKGKYRAELARTLDYVERQLRIHNVLPSAPWIALGKEALEPEESPLTAAEPVPTVFSVGQNYPNPFNPTTTISYVLPENSQVTVKVFNSIGQEVATLVNEVKSAGRHEARWDAAGFPSGSYFYRITTGGLAETRRMTLVK